MQIAWGTGVLVGKCDNKDKNSNSRRNNNWIGGNKGSNNSAHRPTVAS